jgi:RHS repeat-associated protein
MACRSAQGNIVPPSGVNTPRQLADPDGDITLSTRYTPWGDTLDIYGTGNFSFGYFGGVIDVATGLLYVGNGQYFDPATGRFLTRDASPNSTNPYVPWSPLGALIGPLGLVVLFFGRRKKGSKASMLLVLLLVGVTVGMTLASCAPGGKGGSSPTIPPSNGTPGGPGTFPSSAPIPSSTPTPTLNIPECPTAPPTSTLIGNFIMSAYYIPTEDQYRKYGGAKVSIPAVVQRSIDIVGDPSITLYLSKTHRYDYESNTDNHRKAIWGFLYDTDQGICVQGTGKLDSGEYISCTVPPGTPLIEYRFDWQLEEKVNTLQNSVKAFETVAVCNGVIPIGTEIVIPELASYLQHYGKDTTLTVIDTGEGLCKKISGEAYETLDLFVGEGLEGLNAYYSLVRSYPKTNPVSVYYR